MPLGLSFIYYRISHTVPIFCVARICHMVEHLTKYKEKIVKFNSSFSIGPDRFVIRDVLLSVLILMDVLLQ